jgi:hypothetical protein
MSKALDPAPNGPCPPAAYTTTAARLKTSLAGPASCPRACSGATNPAAKTPGATNPAAKTPGVKNPGVKNPGDSTPNPVTRGPSSASNTFEGLRSPCTNPAS